MRITCISDTHSKHQYLDTNQLLDCDTLVHAGDFTGYGSESQAIDFLQWFDTIQVPHKVLIAGNHDSITTRPEFRELLQKHALSVTYLCNESITIDGINFWGSPYSNLFGSWSWMLPEEELRPIWDSIPLNTDIVVTHGPAHMYADRVNNDWSFSPNVGSPSLTEQLQILPNLKAHVCGHIHESQGIVVGDFLSVNASMLDEHYIPVNNPISFTIRKD